MVVAPLSFLAALAVQWFTARRLRPSRSVGDEAEYLSGCAQGLWVRVPLQSWLVRAAEAAWPGTGPRLYTGAAAVAALTLAVAAAEHRAGPAAAIAALLLLLCLERAVLALHLWPDTALGLAYAVAGLCLGQPGDAAVVAAALAGTFAMAVRIEGAAVAAAAAVVPWLTAGTTVATSAAASALATAAALGLCVHARLRHGHWWPDTTLVFNLWVADTETRIGHSDTHRLMMAALDSFAGRGAASRRAWRTCLRAAAKSLPGRLRRLLGPESFVTEALLVTNRPGYRDIGWIGPGRPGGWLLRNGFTVFAAVFLATAPWADPRLLALWLVLAAIYAGLQTRSRYRAALMPLMAAAAGPAAMAAVSAPAPGRLLLSAALMVLFAWLMARAPRLLEDAPLPG